MSSTIIDPEDETEQAYAEKVKLGFQDASGARPRVEYQDISDLHVRAQGDTSERIQNRTSRKARTSSTDTQLNKNSIQEPEISVAPVYPKNRVIYSESGHLVEVDNTPGYERIHIKHANGTRVEFLPNGSVRFVAQKNRYTAIAGNEELVVRGNTSIVLESDASVRCEGDLEMQVEGDYKALIQGNYSLEVQGNVTERFHGNASRTITGTYLRDTRGSVTERNLSNYLCWNKGTYTVNIGDSASLTTENTLEIISDKTITMECEGGYIDITSPDSAGDDSYIVSGTHYADNMHISENIHGAQAHFDSGFFTDLDVTNVIEAEVAKATYATTAGQAGSAGTAGSLGAGGTASPTTPAPTSPTDQNTPTLTTLEAVDVAENSDNYISAIDRSVFYGNKYNKRKLNTYEVWSRMNNNNLRYNQTWMQDQVDYGAIKDTATASSAPSPKRTFILNNNKLGMGFQTLGNKIINDRGFKLQIPNKPLVDVIPKAFKIDEATRATRLSPFFTMGNMLGGDANGAQLIDQGGLSKTQIAQNCQLVAYNILEEFRNQFQDRWTISQGLYNLLDQEKLSSSSINCEFLQGLAVGIQFDEEKKGIYYDAAVWAANNLVFDKIILSYIDYDPNDVNEPTLIITIANGNNSKSLATHFNNEIVSSSQLQDLSP